MPHEPKSRAPATKAFLGGILDGVAVGQPIDKETAAPVGVFQVEQYILAHEIQATGAFRDLEEAVAPPLLVGDLFAVLGEDGVEPVLESDR